MHKMLNRLIGENIDLVWNPGRSIWPIKIDPTQIDQILANLCVNARDAIADVGKIIIETKNVTIDEYYCSVHPGFVCGDFAMVVISDNGSGMDKATQDKVFDPFFTTKGLGRGTGLGLSTVYGIVKQNDGFINVYSEMELGTTFRIYLPRYRGDEIEEESSHVEQIPIGHGETILIVEDEKATLELVERILLSVGYHALVSDNISEAMQIAAANKSDISLLITDVIMPEMNGKELCKHFASHYPVIKCLFMSGYTADIISNHGVLKKGYHFIQKPFSRKELAIKVKEVLDG
jgi:CheY-like chemotaxis protein